MKFFTAYRPNVPVDTHDENQRNAPDMPQFEGVIFSDGTVAVRWLTAKRSTSVWQSLEDMLAIHGHPEYGTRFEYKNMGDAATREDGMKKLEVMRQVLKKASEDMRPPSPHWHNDFLSVAVKRIEEIQEILK